MEQTQNPPGSRCTKCGTAIVGETTGGLCPRCLLEMNLASRTMPGGEASPQAPPPSPREIAGRFPQFEIIECLGRGGMSVVYNHTDASRAIIGLWQPDDGENLIEFFPDGTMMISDKSTSVGGKYSFLEDGRMKIDMLIFGSSVVETMQISINGDVMTTIHESGKQEELKRVRIEARPLDPSVRNAIIGKWLWEDGNSNIEFFADGTLRVESESEAIGGKYSFLDDGRIKIEILAFGTTSIEAVHAAVQGDVMTTTDSRGRKDEFTRLQQEVAANRIAEVPDDTAAPGQDIRISSTQDGMLLDGRKVTHEELAEALKQLHPDTKILTQADPSLRHKEMVDILETCREAGLTRTELVPKTDEKNQPDQ